MAAVQGRPVGLIERSQCSHGDRGGGSGGGEEEGVAEVVVLEVAEQRRRSVELAVATTKAAVVEDAVPDSSGSADAMSPLGLLSTGTYPMLMKSWSSCDHISTLNLVHSFLIQRVRAAVAHRRD
jgi:hypothetical protein